MDHEFWLQWGHTAYSVYNSSEEQICTVSTYIRDKLYNWFRNKKVIDLGCGTGEITLAMILSGARVIGVEICPELAQVAAANIGKEKVYCRDWSTFEHNECIDFITLWRTTFGFKPDSLLQRDLQRFFYWLQPGGKIILDLIDQQFILNHFCSREKLHTNLLSIVEVRKFVTQKKTISIMWTNHLGEVLTQFEYRTFTRAEISSWLREAGFEAEIIPPYENGRLVVVGTKLKI